MEREVNENNKALEALSQGFNEAENEAGEFANEVQDAADKTKDIGSRFEKLGGVLKGIGVTMGAAVVAIGSAAVATGASLVKLGDEYNNAVNQISASTGSTGKELEELGQVAQNVYKHNFGDSLEDVANDISEVKKTTGLMGQELEKATESGFALRDTFGFDMQESARAVSALMKNFGISADRAYNIIATGAQNGANKNGDLLDTLNEYSVHYASLGLSADEFIASLIGDALSELIPSIVDALPRIITSIIDYITGNLPKMIEMGIKLTIQLAASLIKAIPQLLSHLPQIVSAIVIGLGKAAFSIVEVGRNIVRGIWDGIHSPSKVFGGIGENMGEGIGVGFTNAMSSVERDMKKAIPTSFDVDASVKTSMPSIGNQGAGNSGGFILHIENFINNSEKDIE